MNNTNELIPEQKEGSQTNTESFIHLENEQKAKDFFQKVKDRLLNVNNWKHLAGAASADFILTNEKGQEVDRAAQKGDHFKIDIPGPGTITGEGHDWVKIEAMEETEDGIAMMVRPATNPQNNLTDTAHFFSEEATSSFVIKKEGNKIIAGVYGRNEKPNTDTEKVVDTIRNAAVATGALSGFSKLQWKSLVTGFVKD